MSDNNLIRCYEVVPGLGIRAVDVSRSVYDAGAFIFKELKIARVLVTQKPRIAPRRADWEVVG